MVLYLTPYNDSKYIFKFMSFNEENGDSFVNLEESSKERWNKISKIVLNKNKKVFRKTLMWINNNLYVELGNKVK